MNILFLGTGAADWPRVRPEEIFGQGSSKEFRRLSSALIDKQLLIDPGPQVIEALEEYSVDLSNIKFVINTHRHGDHFSEETLRILCENGARFVEFVPGDDIMLGKYQIRAYAGNHATCQSGTVHFIISDGEKTLFYGLDGAWLNYEEYKAIKEYRPDLAVLDCTIGHVDGDFRIFEHNNINMVLEMKKSLEKYVGRFCISHMARTLHDDQNTLSEELKRCDVLTAFDGFLTEI